MSENVAILDLVATRCGAANRPQLGRVEQARLRQRLGFIGTELHKGLFAPLLDESASDEVKAYALGRAASRLGWLERHLQGEAAGEQRTYLLEDFSVADSLFTVLNWTVVTPLRLEAFLCSARYVARLRDRPGIARASADESPLHERQRKQKTGWALVSTSRASTRRAST